MNTILKLLSLALVVHGLSLGSAVADGFTPTASLTTSRDTHSAVLLANGKVLVAGGHKSGSGSLASAEWFEPTNEVWSPPIGSMYSAREGLTATLLLNGRVLATGGQIGGPTYFSSAELFNPATLVWTVTGNMTTPRGDGHSATRLPNGKVLVAGGHNNTDFNLSSAELYDPATGAWTATASMNTPRQYHTATLLQNGKVLVAGGLGTNFNSSAELYDPATETWTLTGSMGAPRHTHTATLLTNGMVLAVGGGGTNASYLGTAELFDPTTGAWTPTGSLTNARWRHTATLLASGKVLVAGGAANLTTLSSAELYDPATGTWTLSGPLKSPRSLHTATLMPNGRVLLVGGENDSSFDLASAEIYDADVPLNIGLSGTNLIVSWPSPSALTLQQSTNLTTVNSWSNFVGSVSNNGSQMSATIPATEAGMFFRLGQPLPLINITNQTSITEGNSGVKGLTFLVTRTGDLSLTSSVSYTTLDASAQSPGDYGAVSGTLTFAAGISVLPITVPIFGDMVPEPNEFFAVLISNPKNARIGNNLSIGMILNDD